MFPRIFQFLLVLSIARVEESAAFVRPSLFRAHPLPTGLPRGLGEKDPRHHHHHPYHVMTATTIPIMDLQADTLVSQTTTWFDFGQLFSTPTFQIAVETTESWRQYVPLAVSLLVITDILLGSPVANAALSALRNSEQQQQGDNGREASRREKDSKERIDSLAVAQKALDKAAATTELRRFLDESKSDMDKLRDVQKKLDDQLKAFDKRQAEKEKEG